MKRLVVLLFLLTTCIHAPDTLKMDMHWASLPIYWSRATNMDPVTVILVREGFEYWNTKLGQVVFIEIQPDDFFNPHFPGSVSVYQIDAEVQPPEVSGIVKTIAVTSTDRTTVVIYAPFDTLNLFGQRTALRHEAGHILGMSHSNNDECLMFHSVNFDATATRETCETELRLLRKTYNLN